MLYIDELPTLVRTVYVSDDELLAVFKPYSDSSLNAWCNSRKAFVDILLKVMKRLREDDASSDQDAYTERVVGSELRGRLLEAAGGGEQLEETIRALVSAHERDPAPSPPDGKDILAGLATPKSRPRLDLDEVLIALTREGANAADGEVTCLAVGRVPRPLQPEKVTGENTAADDIVETEKAPSRRGVWIEYRARAFDEWNDDDQEPLPSIILDATAPLMVGAIRAALPRCRVRLFEVSAPELEGAVKRNYIPTTSLTRRALFGRSGQRRRLVDDGDAALAGVLLRIAAHACGEEAGIITHKPLAFLLRACLSAPEGENERAAFCEERNCTRTLAALEHLRGRAPVDVERILWFFGQRGSNALAKCGLIAVLGDPWPDIGATHEDARLLGISGPLYARSKRDAEVAQGLGRGREVRRTPESPLLLVYAGKDEPACWAHVATVHLPHRGGGPTPSFASTLAEEVARTMIERWGIASVALAKLCLDVPEVAEALDSARQLLIRNVDDRSCRAILREDLEQIVKLPARTLEDAFRRAVGDLDETEYPNPRGRGRWRVRHRDQAAATRAIDIVIEALARLRR
jgi:hypothetical protein